MFGVCCPVVYELCNRIFCLYCWSPPVCNLLTNCLPKPSFVEMKNLKMFHVRSLVSLKIDLTTEWLFLFQTIDNSRQNIFNMSRTVSLMEISIAWRDSVSVLVNSIMYCRSMGNLTTCSKEYWNISQDIFGFKCAYSECDTCVMSALTFISVD